MTHLHIQIHRKIYHLHYKSSSHEHYTPNIFIIDSTKYASNIKIINVLQVNKKKIGNPI